ncbi:MAG: serine--tRNA ligase [Patescibacteria group bacterium]
MLDIKFIRENKDIVAAIIKNRNKEVDLDQLIALDDERRAVMTIAEKKRAEQNEASAKIAQAQTPEERQQLIDAMQQVKVDFQAAEEQTREVTKKYMALMLKVPNITSPDTPIGKDEEENKILRQVGEIPKFSFQPKEHDELGKNLGILDTERAGEISGTRFAYLKGDLALLQFALIQFGLEILTNKEKIEEIAQDANLTVPVTAFTAVVPPVFIKPAIQNRMARFMNPEEHYMFPNDDLMLIGSAEHTLGPLHMDQILTEKELPIRYVGYSSAFRREAGTNGKDTRGIIRQHQFDKLEMETFCLPENSIQEQSFLVAIQEYILTSLKLPYQVIAVCTGDMGFPDYRQIDIETWMPGQNRYRETHSADLTGNFQSRRLNTRVKRADGKNDLVHMNDATAIAVGRMLVAIMENNQNEDGSITIPEVLRKYMGGRDVIKKA